MDKLVDDIAGLLAQRGDVGLTILIAGLVVWWLVSMIRGLIKDGRDADAAHAVELRALADKVTTGLAESRAATVAAATAIASNNALVTKGNEILALLPQAIESIDAKQNLNAGRVETNGMAIQTLSTAVVKAVNDLALEIAKSGRG